MAWFTTLLEVCELQKRDLWFKLVSCFLLAILYSTEVFHHGDIATLGHYTARTCLSMPENATPKCTYFDDEHVTHGALPRGLDMKPQRDAYLLFYERMEQ